MAEKIKYSKKSVADLIPYIDWDKTIPKILKETVKYGKNKNNKKSST